MSAEARLKEKNITLPKPATPMANYVGAVRVGNLLFVSGHGPVRDGKATMRGKLGKDLSVEEGYQVARDVGLSLLATVRANLGSLDKVRRVVKVLGMVSSAEGSPTSWSRSSARASASTPARPSAWPSCRWVFRSRSR